MSWPLLQVAVLVTMTHAVRAVGDRLGPRWGALVLGMPSTSAVLLVGGACEGGTDAAAASAEAGLLGLVATVVLPLAYAQAIRRGLGLPAAPIAAIGAYLVTAIGLRTLPAPGPVIASMLALVGVAVACRLAGRLPRGDSEGRSGRGLRSVVLRSAVPAAFVLANRGLGALAGPTWAATFATFPAMSLAVLVSLHLEGGRASVLRMARSMPRGNLLMVAFLVAFRASMGRVDPLGAAAIGYGAVVATMAVLAARGGEGVPRRVEARRVPRKPRGVRMFAPRLEPIMA